MPRTCRFRVVGGEIDGFGPGSSSRQCWLCQHSMALFKTQASFSLEWSLYTIYPRHRLGR
jgi:hypothetical protein